eukprot:m.12344 g.12344  ORF g.12344 m.12344 type:complete len:219 (-) comp9931_c0_seq1:408-1064(-)
MFRYFSQRLTQSCRNRSMSTSLSAAIKTTWDSQALKAADQVNLRLTVDKAKQSLSLHIDAPWYNDPLPEQPVGSTSHLWEYEVVEAFFLGQDDEYLEVEVGPQGHYLVLKLHGTRNMVQDHLPLHVETTTDVKTRMCVGPTVVSRSQLTLILDRWQGTAEIPFNMLPPAVDRWNAYAINGLDEDRVYKALHAAEEGAFLQPDFHRLELFGPLKLDLST